jgi:hypothetical protein
MNEHQPNFFIVGAPKCGTTALSHYLSEHAQIFIPSIKEPHYFATDLPRYREIESREDYQGLFRKVDTEEHIAVGEASVWYLYSKEAIANIHRYNPQAKLIVMLRDPAEMIPSLHAQLVYTLQEDERNLQKALDLQEARQRGQHIPAHNTAPKLLQYVRVASYVHQLDRLFDVFPREQVKLIPFPDFKSDTLGIYKSVLQFLNVSYDGRTAFPVINRRHTYRFKSLSKLVHHPPEWLQKGVRSLKKALGIDRLHVLGRLNQMNREAVGKDQDNSAVVLKLRSEFSAELALLKRKYGLDL